jgi:hypothetical protein
VAGIADAAQVQTLPSQRAIPFAPSSPPSISNQDHPNQERTVPPPILPDSQGGTREIPLPQLFRGCWRGSVPSIDSIVPIDPDAGHTIWLTKVYTLCYKQAGINGKWVLTFAEGSVADGRRVIDQRQSIKVNSVSGADRAELTAYLHFRARPLTAFGLPAPVINTLDELAHLHCSVMPDQTVMEVRAAVFVENNDEPYANITWHTRFLRAMAGG